MDAKALFKAGEKRLGTDEKTFIRIFSARSRAQLTAISSAYHDMYGNPLKKVCFLSIISSFCLLLFYFFCATGIEAYSLLKFLF